MLRLSFLVVSQVTDRFSEYEGTDQPVHTGAFYQSLDRGRREPR